MNTVNRALLTAGILATFTIFSSHASVVWTTQYTGDALPNEAPSDPLWEKVTYGEGPTASVENGILTVDAPYNTALVYLAPNASWAPTILGSTLEVRLKVDTLAPGATWSQTLSISTGTTNFYIGFSPNKVQDFNTGSSFYFMDTTDDFHTYRFTISGTDTLALYVDGNMTAAFSGDTGGASAASPSVFFGVAGSPANAGQVQWDYVQWTNAGSFAPVPEPASVALIGFAIGALFLRRKTA